MNEQKQVENSFWDEKWNHIHGAKHLKYFTAVKLLGRDVNKKILDYGAGNGNFLDLLVELHHEIKTLTAYDISKTAMTICKEKGYSVTSDPFLDGIVYDQVVLIDVLEHLNNPVELLNKIRNIGLEVILVVPNFSSMKQRLQALSGMVPFQNRPQRGGHVYWMNLDVIKEIAAQSKIQVIEFQYLFPNKKIYTLLFSGLFKVFPNVFANSIGVRGVYCD